MAKSGKKKKKAGASKRTSPSSATANARIAEAETGDNWPVLLPGIRIAGACLATLLISSVLLFAALGDTWVYGLDKQVGEIVASRAREQADMGQNAAAIQLYRDALAVRFDDPMQRVWTLHRLTQVLLREQRYDEAVEAAEEALELYDANGAPFSYINQAYRQSRQFQAMADNAGRWYRWAEETGRTAVQAAAKHQQGIALLGLDLKDEAIAAFEAAFAIQPKYDVAFDAGKHLAQRGDFEKARSYLEFVAEHAKDWRRNEAKFLLEQGAKSE